MHLWENGYDNYQALYHPELLLGKDQDEPLAVWLQDMGETFSTFKFILL